MANSLHLVADELEEAVCEALDSLEARCRPGPRGEHDLEVSFPTPFVRSVPGGGIARLNVSKHFVVEVKSNQQGGAKISDLRQLHDWVLRETRRLVPVEMHDQVLHTLDEAKLDAEDYLPYETRKDLSEDEIDGIRSALEALVSAADVALASTMYAVKGLLVVNHHLAHENPSEKPLLESNALRYARANHLAVMSWRQLKQIQKAVECKGVDPVNFWCSLFETDGEFNNRPYDWKERVVVQFDLFSESGVALAGQPKFLRLEPEVVLHRYLRLATEHG